MSASSPRNILWIMTDQHLASCLGCMGNPVIQTPNLDRLAASGVLFENAFCQSPACMASRGSLLTGRYPAAIRVRGMGILPPTETTFPEWLQRHGFRTGAFGKLHLTPELYTRDQLKSHVPVLDWRRFAEDAQLAGFADDPYKKNYGFELHHGCDDACQGRYHDWLRERAAEQLIRRPERINGGPRDLFVSPYPSDHHVSTFIADETESYIRERQQSAAPWFAFCSFIAPHHPFEAPADQIARYDHARLELPAKTIGVDILDPPPALKSAIGEWHGLSEAIQRLIIKHYYAAISLIDDGIGRLMRALEETGQIDDTMIVFVSDHGEHLGHHGLIRKPSFHYDQTLRVPLIIKSPGLDGGRRVRGLVELIDLYPTLLGLLALPVNPGVQGVDWSQALRTSGNIGRRDIYADMFDLNPMTHAQAAGPYCACQTLRTESFKLNIYPTAGRQCSQLFDVRNDPDERINLFHDPAHRDIRDEMLWQMIRRVHANTDPLPRRLTQW